MDQARRWVIKY